MIVIFQTKFEPHIEKRPVLTFEAENEEDLINRLRGQLKSSLEDYNIIIANGFSCINCGLELDYDLYQYNRLCNRCDDELNH